MSVTYRLVDDEHFPKGIEVVGAPSLPRVGDSISVMIYKGDKKVPLTDRVVVEVSHEIQRTGMVDGRDSALALAPAEVVLGKPFDKKRFEKDVEAMLEPLKQLRLDAQSVGTLIDRRGDLYKHATALLAELQKKVGPEPFIDCSDNCDEYSDTKHIATCPNVKGSKLPPGFRLKVKALAEALERLA